MIKQGLWILATNATVNLSIRLTDVVGATLLVDRMNITLVQIGGIA